jgi:hypothetical protein
MSQTDPPDFGPVADRAVRAEIEHGKIAHESRVQKLRKHSLRVARLNGVVDSVDPVTGAIAFESFYTFAVGSAPVGMCDEKCPEIAHHHVWGKVILADTLANIDPGLAGEAALDDRKRGQTMPQKYRVKARAADPLLLAEIGQSQSIRTGDPIQATRKVRAKASKVWKRVRPMGKNAPKSGKRVWRGGL